MGAFIVEIASEKGVEALRATPHVGIGGGGRVIPLVMLTRAVELSQFVMNAVVGRFRLWRVVSGVEGQSRWARKGGAHPSDRAKHVGSRGGAPGRDRSPQIVSPREGDVARTHRRGPPPRLPAL